MNRILWNKSLSSQMLADPKSAHWLHDTESKKACLKINGNSCMQIQWEKPRTQNRIWLKRRLRCRELQMNIHSVQIKAEERVESKLIDTPKDKEIRATDLVKHLLHQGLRKLIVGLLLRMEVKIEKNNSRLMWILEVRERQLWLRWSQTLQDAPLISWSKINLMINSSRHWLIWSKINRSKSWMVRFKLEDYVYSFENVQKNGNSQKR